MEISAAADPLQCPRCRSLNTKFCYYNNYNLSQPRHFCKACKRYWTRGGTLRNVPVGGGCRKNKKLKRHPLSNGQNGFPSIIKPSPPSSSSSNHLNNPFFSSFPAELNFPFSVTRVSSDSPRFDELPRIIGPGLGFSPAEYRNPVLDQNIKDYASLMAYEGMHMVVGNGEVGEESKIIFEGSNQIEQMSPWNSSSSPSSFLWNSNNVGVWFDPSSSVI